jgi:hypothetical protein
MYFAGMLMGNSRAGRISVAQLAEFAGIHSVTVLNYAKSFVDKS